MFESMRVACRKRPVSVDTIRQSVDLIERDLFQEFEDEVPTREIGNLVMRELKGVDTVAYVRFASVYQEFESVEDFAEVVSRVQKDEAEAPFKALQEALL